LANIPTKNILCENPTDASQFFFLIKMS